MGAVRHGRADSGVEADSAHQSAPESGTTRVRLGSRGSDSGAESRTELCNSEYESAPSARDGPTRRYESEDRRPDWVRERGRELGQKSPTRDPHEGPSRTEFRLWARSYL